MKTKDEVLEKLNQEIGMPESLPVSFNITPQVAQMGYTASKKYI